MSRGLGWGLIALVAWAGCGDDGMSPTDGSTVCARHADCDDGVFCNGTEMCAPDDPGADPFGCIVGATPCLMDERCDEEAARCIQDCGFAPDGDGDGVPAIGCGGSDCDDEDPNRFPGNVEVCDEDGHDEDCDPRTVGTRDQDGDGDVDAACCNADPEGGPSFCGADCNDNRRDARPGLPEVCDALDNDCDGTVDEGVIVEGYVDADRDLHGDASRPISSCAGLPGFSTVADDCDDDNPARHGAQVEVCDEVDNDCDGTVDESPASTTWYRDADDDGFGSADSGTTVSCVPPEGHVLRLGDCDDTDRGINPLAAERCNGIDDDCNGRADYAIGGDFSNTEDDDRDGFADATCGGDDCLDADPDSNPDAIEIMDLADNDCDGTVDEAPDTVPWWIDRDGDGWGTDLEPSIEAVERPMGRAARAGDCEDSDASIHPNVPDGCDGIDNDCDGVLDESAPRIAYYADGDGDGWGAGTDSVLACTAPAGTADRPLDCDDTDAMVFPGADERCNGVDSDCDGSVDEDSDMPWYPDSDGDGFGRSDSPLTGCAPPSGYVRDMTDCDDSNAAAFPGAVEVCNAIDEDCDSTIDETTDAMCADLPGGTGTCVAGACDLVCDADRGNCNALETDGCEVDLTTSVEHCGGCFAACSPGDTCGVAGAGCDESAIVQLVAGVHFTVARRAGGGLAVWGSGANGRHGAGNTVNQLTPVVGVAPPLVHVDAGWDAAVGIAVDGRAFAWGLNSSFQLGAGGTNTSARPGGVYVVDLVDVAHAAMGRNHACAVVREDEMGTPVQRVYCWGNDAFGQLGPGGDGSNRSRPILVPGIDDAQQVYAGNGHTCVLRVNAAAGTRVSCFGRGGGGMLGDGLDTAHRYISNVVSLPTDTTTFVQGAGARTCVNTASGRVYCWGMWPGDGTTKAVSPVVVSGAPDVIDASQSPSSEPDRFASEHGFACVVRDAAGVGEVWCWGSHNSQGKFPGDAANHQAPVQITDGAGTPLTGITRVAAGYHHGCAVQESAGTYSVWCWGANGLGQAGVGSTATPVTPTTAVSGLP